MLVGASMKTAYSFLAYFCFALSGMCAGWDTNAWSGTYHRYYLDASTNKVFIKEVLSSNAFAAIEERADISGVAAATTNAWFRNNRADLVNIKSWINSNADEFMVTNVWTETDIIQETPATNTWVWANCDYVPTSGSGSSTTTLSSVYLTIDNNITKWTAANLLSELSLPSDYLTSTPWRKLTDPDTTNGWHAIDDILNKLIFPFINFRWIKDGGSMVGLSEPEDTTWAAAKTDAEGDWQSYNQSGLQYPKRFSEGFERTVSGFCTFDAYTWSLAMYPTVDINTSASNYTANVESFVYVDEVNTHWIVDGGGDRWPTTNRIPGSSFFDAQGTSYTQGLNSVWSSTNISSAATNSIFVGNTNGIPTWCLEPDGTSGSTRPLRGSTHNESLGWGVMAFFHVADYINSSSPITYYAD